MPQLDSVWFASQLFWLAVSFTLFYVVMSRVVLPPLMAVMSARETTVQSDLAQANDLKQKAEHARSDYERTLADARLRSQQLIDEAMTEQKEAAEKAGKDMDATIAAKLNDAEKRIAERKAQLIDQMVPTAGELTSMIVEKLTNKRAGGDRVSSLIGELSKAQRNG